MEELIRVENVTKRFAGHTALDNVSLSIPRGAVYGLLGPNGAGKTTLIRIINRITAPDSGKVWFNGHPLSATDVPHIGYLPEERGLYPKKVIIDQLTYFAELKGMSRKDAVKAIDYWLDRLGMTEYRNKRLDTLSKGNQQKIQLITAVAHDPDIVILDEPFSGLDPVNAMLLKDVVREQIAKGKIVLFSSHQMSYIEEFCDSIAILNKGVVAISGDLRDIKRDYPRDRLVVRSEGADKIAADFGEICKVLENGDLMIQLADPSRKKAVMTRLVEHYDIDEVKVYEPSLNDIFVEFAGDGAKEG